MIKQLVDVHYDPDTGRFFYNGLVHGTVNADGYVVFRADSKVCYAHRAAWFKVHGYWPTVVDHKNGDRADNRISNLRNVTQQINCQNTVHGRGSHFHKPSSSWKSSIQLTGKQVHLGYFCNASAAEECYLFAKEFFHQPLRNTYAKVVSR